MVVESSSSLTSPILYQNIQYPISYYTKHIQKLLERDVVTAVRRGDVSYMGFDESVDMVYTSRVSKKRS